MRSLHSTQAQARGARAVCHLLALLVALAAAPALAATPVAAEADAPAALLQQTAPSPLLAIDQNRATVVDRIVSEWGEALVKSNAGIDAAQLRSLLNAMRADHLLAASLAGNLEGLRNVVAGALTSEAAVKPGLLQTKALGDAGQDVVYVPVTPCRLVETRGSFAAVYQGGGAFAGNETRNYTLVGGNGVCLTQLPGSLTPSAIQLQVFGIPTTVGSGDIEILPQGGVFGSTTTLVYLGNNPFTSSAATSLVNLGNKQIGVQVRGGGAHVAIDVVGYFRPPAGGYVSGVTAGAGLTGGTISSSGTLAVDTAVIQSRVTGTCAAGSSIRTINANGTVVCEVDDVGGGGGGTVTSVGTGSGLTGGPITGSGTINLANTQLLPTVACASDQAPKWSGSAWSCSDPSTFAGNLNLANSTSSTVGNVTKAGNRFIHNFGNANTFTGVDAGNFAMTGYWNTGSGYQALFFNTSGHQNTASGYRALYNNTTGPLNTAVGTFTLLSNTIGQNNTAVGAYAMNGNTTGLFNTAIGAGTLGANTTGGENTAIGLSSLAANTIGASNTALGVGALGGNSTGSHSIAIGRYSLFDNTTGSYNIGIGNAGVAGEGQTIRIGDANQTRTFVAGISGVTPAGAALPVIIDGNGQLGTGAASAGTVTSVTAGTGLVGSPNPITSSGTLNVDTAVIQSRVTGTCAAGSSIRTINANGTVVCEADDVGGSGTVTSLAQGTGITLSADPITTSGTISADTAYLQRRVSSTCAVGSSIRAIAADGTVTCQTDNVGPADAFVQGGNLFGTTARLGTGNNQDLELIANAATVLRVAPGQVGINATVAQHPANVELALFGYENYANLYMRQFSYGEPGGYLISVGDGTTAANDAWFYLDQYKPSGTNSGQNRRLIIDAGGRLAVNRGSTLVSGPGNVPLSVGSDGSTGNSAYLSPGGTWTNGSSRTFKEDFAAVDGESVLAKVQAMPITTWRYRDSNEGRHMGPIAEDFAAAFGLGDGDRYIGTIDGIGVALAAIQGLGTRMDSEITAKDARIAALEAKLVHQAKLLTDQLHEIAELRRAVDVMLARTTPEGKLAAR